MDELTIKEGLMIHFKQCSECFDCLKETDPELAEKLQEAWDKEDGVYLAGPDPEHPLKGQKR